MSDVRSVRRYYLGKRWKSEEWGEVGLAMVWQAKQEAQPGTPLPADFPFRGRLKDEGFTTSEDLDGSDVDELKGRGFSAREAAAIMKEAAAL